MLPQVRRQGPPALALALVVLLSFATLPGCSRSRPVSARHLLLISIDTLRARNLGSYGYERDTSPRLDTYARRGRRFVHALSSSSWTVPAHATLLTGLEPVAHGLIGYPRPGRLDPGIETLATLLSAEGFRTAAFTGGGFMSDAHGLDLGFETFESPGLRFEQTLPRALAWLDRVDASERTFLMVHGFDVHKPYHPPARFRSRFCGSCDSDFDVRRFQPNRPRPGPPDLAYVVSQYDGEIAYADEQLGTFLDELERRDRLRETLVVITSDHGDEWYEHENVDHGHTLYEELIHVPLLIFGPGVTSGVEEDVVGLIDVPTTALALLGLRPPAELQGRNLLAAAPLPPTPRFAFTGFSEYPYRVAAVRSGRWKLLVWELSGMRPIDLDATVRRPRYTYKFRDRADDFVELFDLARDPAELRDVAAEHPDRVRELSSLLERRVAESRRIGRAARPGSEPDGSTLETLRALGYLE